jgi:hypothetical protein
LLPVVCQAHPFPTGNETKGVDEMSVRLSLLLITITVGGVIALIVGIVAGVLSRLAGTHPAGAILQGGATFAGVLLMEVAVLTLIWTVAGGPA